MTNNSPSPSERTQTEEGKGEDSTGDSNACSDEFSYTFSDAPEEFKDKYFLVSSDSKIFHIEDNSLVIRDSKFVETQRVEFEKSLLRNLFVQLRNGHFLVSTSDGVLKLISKEGEVINEKDLLAPIRARLSESEKIFDSLMFKNVDFLGDKFLLRMEYTITKTLPPDTWGFVKTQRTVYFDRYILDKANLTGSLFSRLKDYDPHRDGAEFIGNSGYIYSNFSGEFLTYPGGSNLFNLGEHFSDSRQESLIEDGLYISSQKKGKKFLVDADFKITELPFDHTVGKLISLNLSHHFDSMSFGDTFAGHLYKFSHEKNAWEELEKATFQGTAFESKLYGSTLMSKKIGENILLSVQRGFEPSASLKTLWVDEVLGKEGIKNRFMMEVSDYKLDYIDKVSGSGVIFKNKDGNKVLMLPECL